MSDTWPDDALGWVVIEWNQASMQPSLADDTVCNGPGEAQDIADWHAKATRQAGRRERFSVHKVEREEWQA